MLRKIIFKRWDTRRLSENRIFVQDKARNERKPEAYSSYVEDFLELSNAVMGEKTVLGQPPSDLLQYIDE